LRFDELIRGLQTGGPLKISKFHSGTGVEGWWADLGILFRFHIKAWVIDSRLLFANRLIEDVFCELPSR
jgi:hypothetical protein